MDTIIDQQVEIGEALVPHAKRLRIGRSNFHLLSDIKSKESTLQLVYDVLRLCPFFKAFLVKHKDSKKINEMYYPWFTKVIIHHFMSKDPFILRRNKFGALLPIELTNEDIRNFNAYKEYYVVATGAAPPKPKASVQKTRSSSDTTITPPTAVAGLRMTTSAKGKQAAKASKAKSLSALSENSTDEEGNDDEGKDGDGDEEDDGDDGEEGDGDDEDNDGKEGDDDDDQEVERDDEKNDKEEGSDEEQDYDEEEYVHPSLSTHAEEEPRDEES
nr:hypothetical protein [Tanacetum cinerariifolium]GFB04012.1 hypothetical protein [Tanacetum cinerariifolium]